MKVATVKKTLNYLVIFIGLLCILDFVYIFVFGGGVEYKDVYTAFDEIKDLENKNLLHNPPESLSKNTKEIMEYFQNLRKPVNSATVEEYMFSVDKGMLAAFKRTFILAGLFILLLIARICMIFPARFKAPS